MDDVFVFASLWGFFISVQLGILSVLGPHWIGVVATAQQVQMAGSIADALEEEENTSSSFTRVTKDTQTTCERMFTILATLNSALISILRSQQAIKSMSVYRKM